MTSFYSLIACFFLSCSIYDSLHTYFKAFEYLKLNSRRFSLQNSAVTSVTIVGGGAAGCFSAIQCAQLVNQNSGSKCRVIVLESGLLPLSKVLISGGGRCNVGTFTRFKYPFKLKTI
mmetsp:Transcript_7901/g.11811  ORF Transcript_7901/g.11811 Transcript_7901/m.11811 type:complete len:117 (-) Transcript_7901:1289-1639(-)